MSSRTNTILCCTRGCVQSGGVRQNVFNLRSLWNGRLWRVSRLQIATAVMNDLEAQLDFKDITAEV